MITIVSIKREVMEGILSYLQYIHPREGILLLSGKSAKDKITVKELVLPPQAVHGEHSSGFPLSRLPIDTSIVGVVHSHPSGALIPSPADYNHFYGRIMIIVGYPYLSEKNMVVFDGKGEPVKHEVVP